MNRRAVNHVPTAQEVIWVTGEGCSVCQPAGAPGLPTLGLDSWALRVSEPTFQGPRHPSAWEGLMLTLPPTAGGKKTETQEKNKSDLQMTYV